jgi:hypothetical protein
MAAFPVHARVPQKGGVGELHCQQQRVETTTLTPTLHSGIPLQAAVHRSHMLQQSWPIIKIG